MIFKYEALKAFFEKLKQLGDTQRFKDWRGERVFLLRHDVDFDLTCALAMAKLEYEVGVKSTYFILVTCRTYNVMHADSKRILRQILDYGHEIALHFDPSIYGEQDLQVAAEQEAKMLSFACGHQIRSVSLHNPSVFGKYPLIKGYVNAYDPELFSDANYISDSCYSFRDKDPFEFINNIEKGMVQILLHPMHYSNNGGNYRDVIAACLKRYTIDIHTDFSINATYSKQVEDWSQLVTREK